jgi:hypothetical protein
MLNSSASYIDLQIARVWRDTLLRVLAQVFLIVLITVLIVRWSIAGPIARAAQWMRALRTGKAGASSVAISDSDLLRPLAREMTSIAESLTAARSAAASCDAGFIFRLPHSKVSVLRECFQRDAGEIVLTIAGERAQSSGKEGVERNLP